MFFLFLHVSLNVCSRVYAVCIPQSCLTTLQNNTPSVLLQVYGNLYLFSKDLFRMLEDSFYASDLSVELLCHHVRELSSAATNSSWWTNDHDRNYYTITRCQYFSICLFVILVRFSWCNPLVWPDHFRLIHAFGANYMSFLRLKLFFQGV